MDRYTGERKLEMSNLVASQIKYYDTSKLYDNKRYKFTLFCTVVNIEKEWPFLFFFLKDYEDFITK